MKLWDLYKGKDYHIEPTLRRIQEAIDYVGNPQKSFPSILVGGTNGKGSTCAFLERILREHGLKTGWFVSPHLVEERERWRINGYLMPEETLKDYVRDLRRVFERFDLTYFEAATLIALLYFKDQGVDIAVMEVGMGGRWDATKVSDAVVVGVTNAERDHTRWLGENVEKIAWEKLHLYRREIPLVLGSSRYPLYAKALEMGLDNLICAGEDFTYGSELIDGRTYLTNYEFKDIFIENAKLGLLGKWQADNAAMAITLAKLFTDLDAEVIIRALEKTRWEGRMEILREDPLLVVDGSHNPYSVGRVVKGSLRLFGDVDFVFTGLKEKEWKLSMGVLRRFTDKIILTEVSHYRGESIKELYEGAKELGFREIEVLESPARVFSLESRAVALGSLYLVGEIKGALEKTVI